MLGFSLRLSGHTGITQDTAQVQWQPPTYVTYPPSPDIDGSLARSPEVFISLITWAALPEAVLMSSML